MKIVCVGGGPAGLYFSILLKKSDPRHEVTVFEQNRPDDTFGWGVVFSDASLDHLAEVDAPSHRDIAASLTHWDRIDIHFKGELVSCGGHGYGGIGRHRLLRILQSRAQELGVKLQFERAVPDIAEFAGCDLIVGADGVNSRVRDAHPVWFQPEIRVGQNRYVWLGSRRTLEAFTFAFEQTEWGWFQLHAYPYAADASTFIVETREETWRAAGLDRASLADSVAFCEGLFAAQLQGHGLLAQAGPGAGWLNFRRVSNARWHHANVVLIGDAAHTAHFSIGSGTRLALD
ncbi:MAG: FAD-dependent monooxygenase, partial [Rhodocyclaceae bacterium]